MKFTRAALKALGVPDEAIGDVLDAYHSAVEAVKEKAVEPLNTKISKLEGELAEADKEIAAITEQYGENNNDTYKAKYEAEVTARETAEKALEDEKAAHKATTDGYATEKANSEIDGMIFELLKTGNETHGAMLPDAIKDALNMPFYDRSKITIKDGKVDNADDVLNLFAEKQGYLFAKTEEKGAEAGGSYTGDKNDTDPFLAGFNSDD